MANYFEDNDDLRYYLEKGIDWEPIVRLTEYDFKSEGGHANLAEAVSFYKDVLEMIGGFVADEVAPRARAIDRAHPELVDGEVVHPPELDELMAMTKEMELHGLCVPRELGGMQVPMVVFHMVNEMMARADVSVTAHNGFHGGIAMALLMYSTLEGSTTFDTTDARIEQTRFADAIAEIISGETWGSMDLTEPHAGSDLAALRTRAEQDASGQWFVTGSKIFITSGHGRHHVVIARTEQAKDPDDPFAGLDGLSLFLVPAWNEVDGKRVRTVTIDKVEEKIGHHGSATVSLSFERAPAQLIGERGQGFRLMLLLMNSARIGVGVESLGLCESAYRMAKAYAEERPSMGRTIDRHEMIADYLDEMRTDIQAVRALWIACALHEEMAQKLKLKAKFFPPATDAEREALDRLRRRHERKARHLTPLLKYTASEKAVEMARRCIQIHGGAGYITEYGAEKLLRDALVFPIYEGTSQIQSLMAMKDNLIAAVKKPQRLVADAAAARWHAISGRSQLDRRVAKLQTYRYSAIQFLLSRLAGNKLRELASRPLSEWSTALTDFDPKRDFALAMLHAERLTRILADAAIAELLLEQAHQHPEREDVLERYLDKAEPRCRFLLDEITSTGPRLLGVLRKRDEAVAQQAAK